MQVAEYLPLKQGLKPGEGINNEGAIIVAEYLPLKQGLKQVWDNNGADDGTSCRVPSTKTRIETTIINTLSSNPKGCRVPSTKTRIETFPEFRQGCAHSSVAEYLPLKQGLKPGHRLLDGCRVLKLQSTFH